MGEVTSQLVYPYFKLIRAADGRQEKTMANTTTHPTFAINVRQSYLSNATEAYDTVSAVCTTNANGGSPV